MKMIELNKIYCENCLDTMSRMPDKFIDLTVTSPPYDNLRDYNGYVFEFEKIAKELYRVTKDGGVVVWIVGDQIENGSESLTSAKQKIFFKENCGFDIDTIIYEKNGYPPHYPSIKTYVNTHEYMFILSKGKIRTFNILKDRLTKSYKESRRFHTTRHKDGSTTKSKNGFIINKYCSRTSVWLIDCGYMRNSKDEIAFKHPAIFPEQLAADHIYSWSNPGDLVYDPMGGSGTTIKMSAKMKRNWIMSEVSREYCDIAQKRVDVVMNQLTLDI